MTTTNDAIVAGPDRQGPKWQVRCVAKVVGGTVWYARRWNEEKRG